MTDKQSSVVVSRELAERLALPMDRTHEYLIDHRDALDELRALLAATQHESPHSLDMVEPVAYLYSCPEDDLQRPEVRHSRFRIKVITEGWVEEPLYRHAQPPAKSGPWEPLSAPGQIKPGDWLHFTVGGKFICTRAKEILWAGTHREEVIYNRRQNHYFITGMAVEGTSSHKGAMIAKL